MINEQLFILFFLGAFFNCFSQSGEGMVFKKARGGGFEFVEDGQVLTMRGAMDRIERIPEAYTLIKKAKTQTDIATILQFAGGFMVGWPLGTAIGGGDPDWVLAGIGVGVFLASLPFHFSFKKNAEKAVKLYNQSDGKNLGLQLHLSPTKAGLVWTF